MTLSPQHYFEHEADMGIIGHGDTIEEAFVDAAKAMFAIMVDLDRIEAKAEHTIQIEFEEQDLEIALVIWLNALIAEANGRDLVLNTFKLKRDNNHWSGEAQGELWSEAIERGTEVKGATLTSLSVKQVEGQWEARCVVDV